MKGDPIRVVLNTREERPAICNGSKKNEKKKIMTPKDKGGGARKKQKKCHEKFFLAPPSLSLAYKPGKVYGEKTSIWSGLLKSKPIQKSGNPMDVKSMKIQLKLKNSNSISSTVFLYSFRLFEAFLNSLKLHAKKQPRRIRIRPAGNPPRNHRKP